MRSSLRAAVVLLTVLAAGAASAAAQQPTVGRPDSSEIADSNVRVDGHPQDSPDNRGFVIRTSDDKLWLRLLGSLRTLATFDFEGLEGTQNFAPYDIPVPDSDSNAYRFLMSASQTRFGAEASSRKNDKGHVIFARIEADFLGQGNTVRLRHAYVRVDERHVLGQTWTTFTDASALPLTVDLDGPNSSVSLRSVQLRVGFQMSPHGRLAVAVESPSPDVQPSDSLLKVYQHIPDLVAHYRIVRPGLRLQVAGVLRWLSVVDASSGTSSSLGIGGNAMILKDLGERYQLGAQVIVGQGIARYITGFSGRGLDLLYDPETSSYVPMGEFGAYVSFTRRWPQGASTNLVVGSLATFDQPFYPGDFYRTGGYVALNHFMPLIAGSRIGVEAVLGIRRNEDGQKGNAGRLQAIVMYDF